MTLVFIISCLVPFLAVLIGILRANSVGGKLRDFFIEKSDPQPLMDTAIEEVDLQYQAILKEMESLEVQEKEFLLKVQEELKERGTPPETRFERILKDDYPL